MDTSKIPSLFFEDTSNNFEGLFSMNNNTNSSPVDYAAGPGSGACVSGACANGPFAQSNSSAAREEEFRRNVTSQEPETMISYYPHQQRQATQKEQMLMNNPLDRELNTQRAHLHHNAQGSRPLMPQQRSRDPLLGQPSGPNRSVSGSHETNRRMIPDNAVQRDYPDINPDSSMWASNSNDFGQAFADGHSNGVPGHQNHINPVQIQGPGAHRSSMNAQGPPKKSCPVHNPGFTPLPWAQH